MVYAQATVTLWLDSSRGRRDSFDALASGPSVAGRDPPVIDGPARDAASASEATDFWGPAPCLFVPKT
jgi:hypothetical protein